MPGRCLMERRLVLSWPLLMQALACVISKAWCGCSIAPALCTGLETLHGWPLIGIALCHHQLAFGCLPVLLGICSSLATRDRLSSECLYCRARRQTVVAGNTTWHTIHKTCKVMQAPLQRCGRTLHCCFTLSLCAGSQVCLRSCSCLRGSSLWLRSKIEVLELPSAAYRLECLDDLLTHAVRHVLHHHDSILIRPPANAVQNTACLQCSAHALDRCPMQLAHAILAVQRHAAADATCHG